MTADRIALTPVRVADGPQLFEWINDRDLVLLNMGYRPVDETSHRAWLQGVSRRRDRVVFAIRIKTTKRLIGVCQLHGIHPVHRFAELQIRIGQGRDQGRGLGSEAVRALVEFGFRDLNLRRIFLHVFEDNERAVRAYLRAGFAIEGTLREAFYVDGRYRNVLVMALMRPPADEGAGR